MSRVIATALVSALLIAVLCLVVALIMTRPTHPTSERQLEERALVAIADGTRSGLIKWELTPDWKDPGGPEFKTELGNNEYALISLDKDYTCIASIQYAVQTPNGCAQLAMWSFWQKAPFYYSPTERAAKAQLESKLIPMLPLPKNEVPLDRRVERLQRKVTPVEAMP